MKGRQWSLEEDQLLRERVLESIISGGTQLEAFEEVGKKLGRTPGACGFRWNAVLRQMDPDSYTEAKKKRVFKELQKRKGQQLDSMSEVILGLRQIGKYCRKLRQEVDELSEHFQRQNKGYEQLLQENKKLMEKRESYEWYQKEGRKKYRDLVKMVKYFKEEITPKSPVMDENVTNLAMPGIEVDTKSTFPS